MTPITYNFPAQTQGTTWNLPSITISGLNITGAKSQLRNNFDNLAHEFDLGVSGNTILFNSFIDSGIKEGSYRYDLDIYTDDGAILTPISGNLNVWKQITR